MLLQLLIICSCLTCYSMTQNVASDSSIALGKGHTILYNDDTPLYPRSLSQNAPVLSISKYENHTFYFYLDHKVNKYYVRDDTCRFLCLNPCGVAYMTNVLVKHHCKFRIESKADMHRIYVPNSARSDKNSYYRYIMFNAKSNVVQGKTNVKDIDTIPYEFRIVSTKSEQKNCTKIAKMAAINLDAVSSSRCELPKVSEVTADDVTREIKVYSSNKYFYHLRLVDGYVTSSGALDVIMGDNTRFHKEQLLNETNVFRNTDNCKYLCMDVCGKVYMSLSYKTDCLVNVIGTTLTSSVYFQFVRHNNYLTVNSDGSLSNSTTRTYRGQVKLDMTENLVLDAYDKKCNMINTNIDDEDEDEDDKDCSSQPTVSSDSSVKSMSYPLTRSVLPTLLFYFVFKNGTFHMNVQVDKE
ncbi:fibroblast growth factor-2 [Helicoverpa armigera granulovirus]|uniref:Fibroblast growth factor-2 n=1 Tax=Helicoverpa armigera granulovirus TaxID=489830 RepID=A9YMY7_9BBAC|nr:fibroblast growth factor-2 [Helicoverpa armigera granulovirus]ABY47836.1 fibroblast growth factor-2 [Helicoverpa armigera granulovirus]